MMKRRLILCASILLALLLEPSKAQPPMCPVVQNAYTTARLESNDPNGPDFKEVSGIAFSPTQKVNGNPIFYAVSDGGGDARIGIFDSGNGRRLRTLRLDKGFFPNRDWESLTIGSCGKSGVNDSCLYVMDAGDNKARQTGGREGRNNYQILKIKEPRINEYRDNDQIPRSRTSRLQFDYRHSSSPTNNADCEAMFLDHTGWGGGAEIGDIYLATKWDKGNERSKNRLFRIPASVWAPNFNGSTRQHSVRSIGITNYDSYQRNGSDHFMKFTWTNAEMSFDGTLIGLGNSVRSFVFLRCPGQSVKDALVNPSANAKPCLDFSHPSSGQVESFAFTPDKRYSLDLPEGNVPKLGWTKFEFNKDKTTRICPLLQPTDAPTMRPTTAPSLAPTITVAPTPSPTETPCDQRGLHEFTFVIQTDYVGDEVIWELKDSNDEIVLQGGRYPNNQLLEVQECLPADTYSFTITDSFGDGICCQYGPGWYQLWFDSVVIHSSDGKFGKQETVIFSESGLMPSSTPTIVPSAGPSARPSMGPTESPTDTASVAPSFSPSLRPSQSPTVTASTGPSAHPSSYPSMTPTMSEAPTKSDTLVPTSAPTDEEDIGVYCPGVCFSGTLADPSQNAIFSSGNEVSCAFLDAQYRNFYATPLACRSLAQSAQSRGCDCSDPTTSSAVSSAEIIPAPDEEPELRISKMWALLGMGIVLVVACVIAYCRLGKSGRESRDEVTADESRNDRSARSEGDEATLEVALAGLSNHSNKRKPTYVQSWTLWAGEQPEHFDGDTVDETLVEEA
ncbi:unnamed protein product [Cylindrotheca closterium]|uniref:Uncharacterized protein n=1 Tax=Cylindrotheca closterium TaxID=2856 RepID=A0AAD2FNK4_9STRA|nr:unnamed protein product [Cylindrotheca closterium]